MLYQYVILRDGSKSKSDKVELFNYQEKNMKEGIIDKFQKQREELNQRRAIQAWHELKQNDK